METEPANQAVEQIVRRICASICAEFVEDPIQTMWEGHLQYRVARWLLDWGWTLTFGEPGGNNRKTISVSFSGGEFAMERGSGDSTDSKDLRAKRNGESLILELKSYPDLGRKRGRAGMRKGLKKDLDWIREPAAQHKCFLFVADTDSYLSMRGHREGERGPPVSWYVNLPPIEDVAKYSGSATVASDGRVLWRLSGQQIDRVVCAIWKPEQAFAWVDGCPPW